MPLAVEMRSLTQSLTRSDEERTADLAALRGEVRRRMAAYFANRMESAATLRHELAEETAARHSAVMGTLAEFGRGRTVTADRQRADLSRVTGDRRVEVATWLTSARRTLADAAVTQQRTLGRSRDELAHETAKFLGDVRASWTSGAAKQREVLAAGRAALQAEVSGILGKFGEARAETARDLLESHRTWDAFTQTMQTRRAGMVVSQAVTEEQTPPAPSQSASAAESGEAPSAGPFVGVEPVAVDLPAAQAPVELAEDAVFAYLADHPDGVRLVELVDHFGTGRTRVLPLLNRLMEESKARKDEERRLYFAS